MKFNSFIESLRETGNSQFTDNQLSTDVICIDQISHPINNDRRDLFYKYAETKELIQKFNDNLNLLHTAKPTDENLRDDGVYRAFASAYINTSEEFTNNLSHKNFNTMVNNCIQCHEKFCLGTIQKINKLYIRK